MKLFKLPALLGLFAFALVATLAFTGASGAAASGVPLGTAADFAILAGSGITNTGATTISGDSGSSPTTTETGFGACPAANCVSQTGTNHVGPDPNDTATQSAKAALTNAYNVAAGQTPTTIGTELAGQSLAPGVYNSASGTFGMSGTLTLDAGNDPNAVFIFQTAEGTGTLITGGTGNVSLIRSAQSCNVFWKVGTSATLGAGSTFRGTIMAHTSISLGAAVTVDGRLLAGEQASAAGAVTLINDTVVKPACAIAAAAPAAPVATTTDTSAAAAKAATASAVAAKAAAAKKAVTAKKAAAAKTAAKKAAAAKAQRAKAQTVARQSVTSSTSNSTSISIARGSAKPPVTSAGFTG
jgi:Ice-binding-like